LPAQIWKETLMVAYYKNGNFLYYENLELSEKQIEYILDEFNFEKIQSVMKHLNWSYFYTNCPPSLDVLREAAKNHLESAYDYAQKHKSKEVVYCGSGGFRAEYYPDVNCFRLSFVIEDFDTIY
jgi:hypothetical protein